nr:transposase [Pseudonocardia sp. EV170527-09]
MTRPVTGPTGIPPAQTHFSRTRQLPDLWNPGCSTNAIESLNARYRRAVRVREHFPTEQAALKCLYLVTRSLDPTRKGRARWSMRWKPALNAFAITFQGRIVPGTI